MLLLACLLALHGGVLSAVLFCRGLCAALLACLSAFA
jgi:hypothetical protein